MKKRITALLLAFAMLFTLSAAALAADESALVPEPAAAELAAENKVEETPAEQLAAPRPVLRAVEAAATHTAHPYCGDKTCEDHGDAIDNWVDLKTVTVSSTAKLTGNTAYYLSGDLSVSSHGCAYKVDCAGQTVTLCLNGYTLSVTDDKTWGRAFNVINGTLRICDCSEAQSGKIITNGTAGDGAVIMLRDSAPTLELYGGTLTSTVSVANGGVICQNKGTFHMYGGTITGGKATKAADQNKYGGGGVYVGGGTFYMHGGTITGCTATENGGGVYLNSGTFTVSGAARITGNHVGEADNNVYLPAGKTITADDLTSGAQIGVTAASAPTAITGANGADIHGCFTSDNSAYEPWNGTGNAVVLRTARTTPTCNAPSGLTAVYGQKLSEIELTNPEGNTPGTWTWENGNQDVGNVGGHTFKATFTPTDGDSYKTVTGIDVTVTVTQADQTITITGESKKTIIHNGKPYSIDYATALGGATITYSLESAIEGVSLDPAAKTLTVQPSVTIATDITIKATAAATENYKSTSKTFIVTVAAKSDIELTITMEGWTYGETANTPTYTKPVSGGTETITYAVKDTTAFSNTVPTDVGEYVVKVVYETDNTIYTGTKKFTIAKKQITPPTADSRTFTYNGEDQTYTLATSAYYDISNNATQKNAGTYTITVSLKNTQNTCWDDNTTAAKNYTFKIETLKVDVPAADTATFTYTGQPQTYTAADFNETYCEVRGNVQTAAGDHTVTVSLKDAANTEWKTGGTVDVTFTFNITKADVPDFNKEVTLNVINDLEATYTVDLPELPELASPKTYGGDPEYLVTAVSLDNGYTLFNPAKVENGKLILPINKNSTMTTGPSGYVHVKVTTDNYEDVILTVNLNAVNNPASHTGYSEQVKKQSEEFEAKKRGELPESDSAFRDVAEDDYFFDAVNWAAENGITGGVSSTRFGPGLDCTRGQTMTFLWRAMGEPEPDSLASSLTDVMSGSYYYKAVLWAMQEGVTTGMGKNIFAPDTTVTRGQFVTFLYRLANASGSGEHPFTDVPASSYYEAAIAWVYSEGITTGTGSTTFSPDAPCTRAQIVTFLYRAFAE